MSDHDLKRFAIFADLSAEERDCVEELLEAPLELCDGEQLFCEGEESDGVILVDSGSLALQSLRAGDLGRLEAGNGIGGASLVAVGVRETTAMSVGETRVLRLSRESFRRLADDEPRAGVRVLEAVLVDLAGALRRNLDALS